MEFLVEQRTGLAPVVHLTFDAGDDKTTFLDALALADNAGADAPVWIHGTTDERFELMAGTGRSTNRTLLQMRCSLPAAPTKIETRAFTEADVDSYVAVNNRAFHWHPEQSGMTRDDVRSDMTSEWFNADGFRLHDIDGELAGFCWTKVHTEPERLGEIYVIAVDPAFHGQGLGKAMTLAGLQWLSDAGLTTGMLYVESDNEAAVATYRKIGFETYRTDTLWRSVDAEGEA